MSKRLSRKSKPSKKSVFTKSDFDPTLGVQTIISKQIFDLSLQYTKLQLIDISEFIILGEDKFRQFTNAITIAQQTLQQKIVLLVYTKKFYETWVGTVSENTIELTLKKMSKYINRNTVNPNEYIHFQGGGRDMLLRMFISILILYLANASSSTNLVQTGSELSTEFHTEGEYHKIVQSTGKDFRVVRKLITDRLYKDIHNGISKTIEKEYGSKLDALNQEYMKNLNELKTNGLERIKNATEASKQIFLPVLSLLGLSKIQVEKIDDIKVHITKNILELDQATKQKEEDFMHKKMEELKRAPNMAVNNIQELIDELNGDLNEIFTAFNQVCAKSVKKIEKRITETRTNEDKIKPEVAELYEPNKKVSKGYIEYFTNLFDTKGGVTESIPISAYMVPSYGATMSINKQVALAPEKQTLAQKMRETAYEKEYEYKSRKFALHICANGFKPNIELFRDQTDNQYYVRYASSIEDTSLDVVNDLLSFLTSHLNFMHDKENNDLGRIQINSLIQKVDILKDLVFSQQNIMHTLNSSPSLIQSVQKHRESMKSEVELLEFEFPVTQKLAIEKIKSEKEIQKIQDDLRRSEKERKLDLKKEDIEYRQREGELYNEERKLMTKEYLELFTTPFTQAVKTGLKTATHVTGDIFETIETVGEQGINTASNITSNILDKISAGFMARVFPYIPYIGGALFTSILAIGIIWGFSTRVTYKIANKFLVIVAGPFVFVYRITRNTLYHVVTFIYNNSLVALTTIINLLRRTPGDRIVRYFVKEDNHHEHIIGGAIATQVIPDIVDDIDDLTNALSNFRITDKNSNSPPKKSTRKLLIKDK